MGWLTLAALGMAFGLVALRANPDSPTANEMYASGGALLAFGVLWAIWMLRTLQTKAYLDWAWLLRWMFFGLAGTLAALIPLAALSALMTGPSHLEPQGFPYCIAGAFVVRVLMNVFR